ncbi:TRAP transporter large permease [Halopenitus salinus]|uniref:TRAP transporter large permease n=1 Tax=Halopenitus salinus TaxID=1198295 RepID=A0ABD5V236_9EURY
MSNLLLLAFFITLLGLYALGVPLGYALGSTVVVVMFLPIGPELNFAILAQRVYAGMDVWVLLAIPFFIFAGRLMNEAGITEDLFDFATELVGTLQGGLAQVNVIVSVIFSGMSGSAVADAAGLGVIEYDAMTSHGFDGKDAVGVTGSSAIIGPIIPPSIPVVIYAVLVEESIGALFMAGVIPGLMMAIALMLTIYFLARKHDWPRGEPINVRRLSVSLLRTIPGLITPAIILGGIMLGIFTATEAAIVASLWAILIGTFYYRGLNVRTYYRVCRDTFEDTASIIIILGFANVYAYWLTLSGIPDILGGVILGISESTVITLLFLTILLLVLGTFMETNAILLILTPVLLPMFPTLGIDPIHFGIVMIVTLMYGLITPPFGIILFVLERVTDETLTDVMKSMLPYYIPLGIVLLFIVIFPELSLYVPRATGLL